MNINDRTVESSPIPSGTIYRELSCGDEPEDALLVQFARSGDEQAFEALIRRHWQKTFTLAYRITKNREDAEDAMQEALIRAHRKLDIFEGKASFHTWFGRIAINQALMCLRRRRNSREWHPHVEDEKGVTQLHEISDESLDPEERILRSELAEALVEATNRLPAKFRSAFTMRYVEGYSTGEVAAALGTTIAAIKSRAMRARTRMRKQFHSYRERITVS